jgi:putative transposase
MPSSKASMAALRDELLNETLFSSLLAHAREVLLLWKCGYNTVRPHSGLGNLTPAAFANHSAPDKQRDGTLRYVEGFAPRPVASPSQEGLRSCCAAHQANPSRR